MKIIIVGGVAGGASAAARLRRMSEEAEISIIERGDYISFANCGLPYHIGGVIKERDNLLVQTVEGMSKRFNIDVQVKTEVVKIDREKKVVVLKNLETFETYEENYDKLLLSPGAGANRTHRRGCRAEKDRPDTDARGSGVIGPCGATLPGFRGREAAPTVRDQPEGETGEHE